MSIARVAALRVLLAIEKGETTLANEVEDARRDIVDSRDRALLLELTAGTLRWQASLDAAIEAQSGRAIETLDPPVRAILRLSAFQLAHLTRVPARAVVHDAVTIARRESHEGAAGFVNAVLRALARAAPTGPAPPPAERATREEQLTYLSVTLSHPAWLVSRWLDRYGFEATRVWCQFNNTTPTPSIRPTGGLTRDGLLVALAGEGIEAMPGRYAPGAVTLMPGALGQISSRLRPQIVVQDEASQLVGQVTLAAAGADPRLLDLCASPGGKTLLLADAFGSDAPIVAADYRRSRVARLREAIRAAGRQIPVVRLDAGRPLPFAPVFSCVLLDAPCSGLGTLRRDPDLKWSRREDHLAEFAGRQEKMLREAARALAPGGRLVYATCSSEPEENQAIVETLVSTGEFEIEPIPWAATGSAPSVVDAAGCLSTRPDRHGLDAFFSAVLVRRERT